MKGMGTYRISLLKAQHIYGSAKTKTRGLILAGLFCVSILTGISYSFPAQAIDFFAGNKMVSAVEKDSVAEARDALLQGFSVNDRNNDRVPVIILAARSSKSAVLQFLVDNGARLNVRDSSGATALTEAANVGSLVMVRSLVEGGADPDQTGLGNQTALMIAAARGAEQIVSYLVSKGADVNASDYTGRTALDLAEEKGFINIAAQLRAAGT